jgi:hypothetical protein
MTEQKDIELMKLEIERDRLKADTSFREVELALKKSELEAKANETSKKSRLTDYVVSPAVVIAIIGVFGTVVGYSAQAYLNRELEQRKFEYEAIKLALQQPTEKDKTDFLVLLKRWKIVSLHDLSENEIRDLSTKGQLPTVRTPAEAQRFNDEQKAVAASCVNAAVRVGVNPHYLLALAWTESRMRPNATSPSSSAFGLFFALAPTWADFLAKHGKDENVSDADKFSASAQCTFGAYLVADQTAGLRGALSRLPTIVELYLAHVLGVPMAAAIIKADPKVSVEVPLRTVRPDANSMIQSAALFLRNGDGSTRTVQQVLDDVNRRMERALTATADISAQVSAGLLVPTGSPKGN